VTAQEQVMQECFVKFLNAFLGAKMQVTVNHQTCAIVQQPRDGMELPVMIPFVKTLARMVEFAGLLMFVIVLEPVTLGQLVL